MLVNVSAHRDELLKASLNSTKANTLSSIASGLIL
jgi:hypothetical protein